MRFRPRTLALLALVIVLPWVPVRAEEPVQHLLYVATPGIRNYVQYGGTGIVVFDIDNGYRFIKRIAISSVDEKGQPEPVKGICASAITQRLYLSTPTRMSCLDLGSQKILWTKMLPGGCDRMSISPDGKVIYIPSFEGPHWNAVDADNGEVIAKIVTHSGSHNTVYGLDGSHVYLAGLKSPVMTVADTKTHTAQKTVGPFGNFIRPFTVNGRQTVCFVNVNDLLGFEVGDLLTGKKLYRVQVQGYQKGPVARHGCPSHGIGLTPDEKELWVSDGHNKCLHIFDATVMPPRQSSSIRLRGEPGWITFSIDGRRAYPSTGDVIDVTTHKVVTELKDETGRDVQSEKLMEINFSGGKAVRAGNQFGLGQVGAENAGK